MNAEKKMANDIFKNLLENKNIKTKEETLHLRTIIWQKFCFWVDVNYIPDILIGIARISALILLGVVLYHPDKSLAIGAEIIEYRDFYFIKLFLIGFVFFFYRELFGNVPKILRKIKQPQKQIVLEFGHIFGVPNEELINHLITFQSFKQTECKQKFGLNQKQFDSIAKKLEKIGVLIRGDNNSRIFNKEFTRQDLAKVFSDKNSVDELEEIWRKEENTYSPLPISFNSKIIKQ